MQKAILCLDSDIAGDVARRDNHSPGPGLDVKVARLKDFKDRMMRPGKTRGIKIFDRSSRHMGLLIDSVLKDLTQGLERKGQDKQGGGSRSFLISDKIVQDHYEI